MVHAHIDDSGTFAPFLGADPVWNTALDWLRRLTKDTPLGRYEIEGPHCFGIVQEYQTQSRESCRFESHRDHVDIQYTIGGSEVIDWINRGDLVEDGPFGDDVQFWRAPESGFASLNHTPGRFSIFLPSDAHRPKVVIDTPALVRKVVIKIHRDLVRFPGIPPR